MYYITKSIDWPEPNRTILGWIGVETESQTFSTNISDVSITTDGFLKVHNNCYPIIVSFYFILCANFNFEWPIRFWKNGQKFL